MFDKDRRIVNGQGCGTRAISNLNSSRLVCRRFISWPKKNRRLANRNVTTRHSHVGKLSGQINYYNVSILSLVYATSCADVLAAAEILFLNILAMTLWPIGFG